MSYKKRNPTISPRTGTWGGRYLIVVEHGHVTETVAVRYGVARANEFARRLSILSGIDQGRAAGDDEDEDDLDDDGALDDDDTW